MLYGMGQNSLCLVRIPPHFSLTEESLIIDDGSSVSGNLSYVTHWEVDLQGTNHPETEVLYVTYHPNEDVWPLWTNNLVIDGLKAPYGEQTSWLSDNFGFYTYFACGNAWDEGESGLTYNSIKLQEYCTGFPDGFLDRLKVVEKNVYDFKLNLNLGPNYPIGENCWVELQWTGDFIPSWILINGVMCSKITATQTNTFCKIGSDIADDQNLIIEFKQTLVKKFVPDEDADKKIYAYLPVKVDVYGDWDNSKRLYLCQNLNDEDHVCDGVHSRELEITITDEPA